MKIEFTLSPALAEIVEFGRIERLATGFRFTEGPVWHPAGYLLFSDIPASRIIKWTKPDQIETFRHPSNQSNGLTLDRQGGLIACEHESRSVSYTSPDGTVSVLADRYQEKRLNSPNDVVVRSNGSVFFTDPPYGVSAELRELNFQGVYRLDSDGTLTLLVDDFDKPNGLAFSPDEQKLYVDDSDRRHVRVFDLSPEGMLSHGRIFAELPPVGPGLPDGLKVDRQGNLFVTGPGGVSVYAPTGDHLGLIPMPEVTSNCAFGDTDSRTLYMTACTSLYRIRLHHPGIQPWSGC